MNQIVLTGLLVLTMAGCAKEAATTVSEKTPGATVSTQATTTKTQPKPSTEKKAAQSPAKNLAPDFTLTSYEGKKVSLSDYRGKVVVLEWFNPDCPFVKYAYDEGPMKSLISESDKQGVVWLSINSGAPGNQGHGAQTNLAAKKAWGLTHPILEDADGRVGRLYSATKTPHMFIVDKKGALVYQGALDTSRGATPEPGDDYTNYTKRAIAAALKGEDVPEPASTKAWGCSVKYAR